MKPSHAMVATGYIFDLKKYAICTKMYNIHKYIHYYVIYMWRANRF